MLCAVDNEVLQFDLSMGRRDNMSVQKFNAGNASNGKNDFNSVYALECIPYHPACVPAENVLGGGSGATSVCVGMDNGAQIFDLHNPQQRVVDLYRDNTILYSRFDYNTSTLMSCGVQR